MKVGFGNEIEDVIQYLCFLTFNLKAIQMDTKNKYFRDFMMVCGDLDSISYTVSSWGEVVQFFQFYFICHIIIIIIIIKWWGRPKKAIKLICDLACPIKLSYLEIILIFYLTGLH